MPDLRAFPMQDGPPIPWYVAEAIYRHLYRLRGQSLDRMAQRGGFTWREVAYMWSGKDRGGQGVAWGTTDAQRKACRAEIKAAGTQTEPDRAESVSETVERSPRTGLGDG